MDANVIRQEVETTYEKVKSLAGWTVEKNVVLTITSYYVTSEREFDAESLSRVMDAPSLVDLIFLKASVLSKFASQFLYSRKQPSRKRQHTALQ